MRDGIKAPWANCPSWSPTRYRTVGFQDNLASWAQVQVLITYREQNVKSKYDQISTGAKVNMHTDFVSQQKECSTMEKCSNGPNKMG